MANYCTYSDVQAKLQNITLTDSSNPTTTEVTAFCTQVTEWMNARFRVVGIDTPITDSNLLDLVKPIAANGVTAEVLRSVEMESESAAVFQDLYERALEKIEQNPSILQENTVLASPGGSMSLRPRAFRKGEQDW